MFEKISPSKKTAIFYVCIGLVLLVATGIYARYYYRSVPRHVPIHSLKDVNSIQTWMTVHYIARAYGVPEKVLTDAVNITPQQAHSQSITAVAKEQHKTPDQVMNTIRSTIQEYKAAHSKAP